MKSSKSKMQESQKNTQNHCRTVLLDDKPATDDAFKDFGKGPYERIAGALARFILEDPKGKAIALIGPWGSGKSTIIIQLKKCLDKDQNTNREIEVFSFDAWAHEGDPLRRSFLEQLINHFLDKDWPQEDVKKMWTRKKEELAKRIRITETKTFPRFTPAGSIMAFVTMLVPIGLVLLSLSNGKFQSWIFWLGIVLSALPPVTLGVLWCVGLKKREFILGQQDSNDDSTSTKRKDVLSFLITGTITDERNETYETPDPTSIEFQEAFIAVLNDALEDPDRRLVIVIDNLDRVGTENALAIWATMRTFFEIGESDHRPRWMDRLWILVPFAPETPKRLSEPFDGDEGQEKDEQQNSLTPADSRAAAFVEKTFQAQFHVPLPVLSDWKGFFMQQLEDAFPDHFKRFENDKYSLYRLFEKKRNASNRPPTPREIKLFINKVGSYHRIWEDEIPLPIQAWYVLEIQHKLKDNSPEMVLLKQELLTDDVERIITEPEWQKYLAALYFNVGVDKAMEVLIGDEVKEALSTGGSDKLKEIQSDVNPSSFVTVLERIISDNVQDWVHQEPPALAHAALALQELNQDDIDEWSHIWRSLRQNASQATWDDLDKQTAKGIIVILKSSPDDTHYESIARAILENLSESKPQESETES